MTENQIITYRNHNGSTTKYCSISIFGLRPPEFLGVFCNPVDYFRYCRIYEKTILNEEEVANMLSHHPFMCPWVDCLGRRVKVRCRALGEMQAMLAGNLDDFADLDERD